MAFAVVAHYRCAPADEAAVRAALLKVREHTRAEPANLAYEVHAEADRPGSFVLYEQYADRAGFDVHKAADHFDALIVGTVWPLLTERTVTFAEVLRGGAGPGSPDPVLPGGGQNSLPQQ